MVDFAAAVVTTILFTVLFTFFIVNMNIDEIKGDWANRRCELAVMVAAAACKPDSDPRSGLQFSIENFKFCSGIIATQVLKQGFAPLFSILSQQFQGLINMAGPINFLRNMIKVARETFEGFLNSLFSRFSIASWLLQRTNLHFQFAFGRIQGIFFSILYLGLSLNTLISNQLDFVVTALKIFLGVISGLFPILIIPIAPFISMINESMDSLENAKYGGGMDGARSVFCVDPDTTVRMANGSTKPLKNVRLGDSLATQDATKENIVTGVLIADAKNIPLVMINKVKMSDSHRVFHNNTWMLARDHPEVEPCAETLETLICLNTTEHSVPIVITDSTTLYVGDWEEVTTEEGRKAWIDLVSDTIQSVRSPTLYPKSVPLLGAGVQVYIRGDAIPIPMNEVMIGDYIPSGNGTWTRVVGLYKGSLKTNWPLSNSDWMSDGIWMKNIRDAWTLRCNGEKHDEDGLYTTDGYQLVTESETFEVLHLGFKSVVRDFTELGASRLDSSYEMLDYYINKK
jgi:hypothetical protein